jgi:hypothetical protein
VSVSEPSLLTVLIDRREVHVNFKIKAVSILILRYVQTTADVAPNLKSKSLASNYPASFVNVSILIFMFLHEANYIYAGLSPKRPPPLRSFLRPSMPLYSFQDPRHSLLHLPLFLVRRRRPHPPRASFVLFSIGRAAD